MQLFKRMTLILDYLHPIEEQRELARIQQAHENGTLNLTGEKRKATVERYDSILRYLHSIEEQKELVGVGEAFRNGSFENGTLDFREEVVKATVAGYPSVSRYLNAIEEQKELRGVQEAEEKGTLNSNKEARNAALKGYLTIVQYLNARCLLTQQDVDDAYVYRARGNGHLNVLQYLDDPAKPGFHPNQRAVNDAYMYAAVDNSDISILQYLDDPARPGPHPTQQVVNDTSRYAATYCKSIDILKYLNNPAKQGLHPDQQAVNDQLEYAISDLDVERRYSKIKYLLNPQRPGLDPDQQSVNKAFVRIIAIGDESIYRSFPDPTNIDYHSGKENIQIVKKDMPIFKYFRDPKRRGLHPDQEAVNEVVKRAVDGDKDIFLRNLLDCTLLEDPLRPGHLPRDAFGPLIYPEQLVVDLETINAVKNRKRRCAAYLLEPEGRSGRKIKPDKDIIDAVNAGRSLDNIERPLQREALRKAQQQQNGGARGIVYGDVLMADAPVNANGKRAREAVRSGEQAKRIRA